MGPSQGDCPGEDGVHGVRAENKFFKSRNLLAKDEQQTMSSAVGGGVNGTDLVVASKARLSDRDQATSSSTMNNCS